MANSFGNPIILDTDITSYRTAASVPQGLRITKLVLAVGGSASSAGNVTITAPSDSAVLYPPIPVTAATAANTMVFSDTQNDKSVLTWRDFAVTGLTATGTKLYLWGTV